MEEEIEDLQVLLIQRVEYWQILVDGLSQYKRIDISEHKLHRVAIFDMQLCMAMGVLDIAIGLKNLNLAILTNNNSDTSYCLRILALNYCDMFISINKLNVGLAKEVRNITLPEFIEAHKDVKRKLAEINKLKTEHYERLVVIRHNVIAHRLGTGIDQVEITNGINIIEIREIGEALVSGLMVDMFIMLQKLNSLIFDNGVG